MEKVNQPSTSHIQVYENMLKSFFKTGCVLDQSHSTAKASQPGTHYIAQVGLKLVTILSCLSLLGAGISRKCHYFQSFSKVL